MENSSISKTFRRRIMIKIKNYIILKKEKSKK